MIRKFGAAFILCSLIVVSLTAQRADATDLATYRAAVQADFKKWVQTLWPSAKERGVTRKTFDAAFRGVTLNWRLPELIPPKIQGLEDPHKKAKRAEKKKKRQPEFDVPEKYFPQKSLSGMTARGRQHLKKWDKELSGIQQKYGVPKSIILAIWGRETAYGTYKLRHYAIRALATEAYMGLRKAQFRDELLRALVILEEGHIPRKKMLSSWAGAMGHTQFMPSDFQKHAVDHNGDGKRDIWSTIPDAFASTANYLNAEGWQAGKTWGYEVHQVSTLDCTQEGPWQGKPVSYWQKMGAKRTYDRKFSPAQLEDEGYLLMPAGTYGPAFILLKNFYVIKQYNYADLYALFVGHVSDRMAKDRPFQGPWKKVDKFTRDEMRDLQRALMQKGFYADKIDGFIGSKSRVAIGNYQKSQNLPVTCYPTRRELKQLLKSLN